MEERIAVLETQMVELQTDIGEIKIAVCGKAGLGIRVDRIEQRRFLVDWVLKIIIGAGLGAIVMELFK